jgi:hypothetical protein
VAAIMFSVLSRYSPLSGHLLQSPEQRLQPYLTDVEKTAWSSVKEGERLIFFFFHRPFVSKDHKVVNAGSWVLDAKVRNTFVEIDDEKLRLWNFKDKNTINDITDDLVFPISTDPRLWLFIEFRSASISDFLL